MKELLSQDDFFRTLFNSIPVCTMIMDADRQLHCVNDAALTLLGLSDDATVLKRRCGEVFNCISSRDNAEGCGHGIGCPDCVIWLSAISALEGNSVHRTKGEFYYTTNGDSQRMNIMVTAAPFIYQDHNLVIVIMEDISNISELQGLLPICYQCKKIRDDKGYWIRVESYIRKRAEVDFTHGLCPDCHATIRREREASPEKSSGSK